MLHVAAAKSLWKDETLTGSIAVNSEPVAAEQFIEGRLFVKAAVSSGTWTPKLQQKDPQTGEWFDRSDSFTALTATHAYMVTLADLGSRLRVVLTPSGGGTPSVVVSITFEGKS